MLTAMVAVENIVNAVKSKDNLWSINTETDYHEEKTSSGRTLPEKHEDTESSSIRQN